MTLATVCRSIAVRCGAPVANAWVGNPDPDAVEVLEFAREALATVAAEHHWQALMRTHSATLTGAIQQTIALPADFDRLFPQSLWLDGETCPVRGPVTDEEFETRINTEITAVPVYRLTAGAIDLLGAPLTGTAATVRYLTRNLARTAGGAPVLTWQADTDEALISERLCVLLGVAMWREAKAMDAGAALGLFATALARARAEDRPMGVMDMTGGQRGDNNVTGRPSSLVVGFGVLS